MRQNEIDYSNGSNLHLKDSAKYSSLQKETDGNPKNIKSNQNEDLIFEDKEQLLLPLKQENKPLNNQQSQIFQAAQYKKSLIFAMLSALCFAIHNYTVSWSIRLRQNSSSIIYSECITFIGAYLLVHLYLGVKSYRNTGKFWLRNQSQFINKFTKQLSWIGPICLMGRGFCQAFANIFLGLVAKYSRFADVSPSVMLSTMSLSAFFVAIVFYLIYKEKINSRHILGMMLIIFCVFLIAISKNGRQGDSQQYQQISEEDRVTVFVPISFALMLAIFLTVASVCVRQATSNGYNAQRFGIDQQFFTGVIYLALFIESHYNFLPYTVDQIIIMQVAAVALLIAIQFFNIALSMGKGGIVMSITSIQNVYQLTFEVIVERRIPNLYEIFAILSAMSGAIIIGLAKK